MSLAGNDMDYNKIIIVLVIILVTIVVAGFVLLTQSGNNAPTNVNNTTNTTDISNNVEHINNDDDANTNNDQASKPARTEYTGDPNDREAYTEWRKQDLQSENPHRGYSLALDGPENSPSGKYS